jgi:hypothetical protein
MPIHRKAPDETEARAIASQLKDQGYKVLGVHPIRDPTAEEVAEGSTWEVDFTIGGPSLTDKVVPPRKSFRQSRLTESRPMNALERAGVALHPDSPYGRMAAREAKIRQRKNTKEKGRQRRYDKDRVYAVRRLHREGYSVAQIAKRFRMPVPTVYGMLTRYTNY